MTRYFDMSTLTPVERERRETEVGLRKHRDAMSRRSLSAARAQAVQDDARVRELEAANVEQAVRALEAGEEPKDRLPAMIRSLKPVSVEARRRRRAREWKEAQERKARPVHFIKRRPKTWTVALRPFVASETYTLHRALRELRIGEFEQRQAELDAAELERTGRRAVVQFAALATRHDKRVLKSARMWFDRDSEQYHLALPNVRELVARDVVTLAVSAWNCLSDMMADLPPVNVKDVYDV